MNLNAVLSAVNQIATENPTYELGGSGENGTCDCVGLIMGAAKRVSGAKYPLHSSNYFARWEMATLESTEDVALVPCMLVYKARADSGDLNARYKDGGKYYNGDFLDYYHVGIVTSVNPLRITHCTSGNGINGITHDSSLKGWTHAGKMIGIDYEEVIPMEDKIAFVHSADGNPVKLRPSPSTDKPYLAKIAIGTQVTVTEEAQGWSHVITPYGIGYMMSQFLTGEASSAPVESWQEQVLAELRTIREYLVGGGSVG